MRASAWVAIFLVALAACSNSPPPPANATPAVPTAPALIEIPRGSERAAATRKNLVATGDLDAIVERGSLRILAARSRTHFVTTRAGQRGRTVDAVACFEAFVNARIAPRHIVIELIETPEQTLISGVLSGSGDVA